MPRRAALVFYFGEIFRLVGVISIGDLVKSIISDQQFIIEQLVRYISG
jgi:CBS domain-containing protein